MKAIVYYKKHSSDKLIYCDVEKPRPTDNEILIKIVCASLNAADYRSMKMGITPKKKIFGSAIAGRIESVGKNIRQFKPGDEVLGDLSDVGFGGLAEYAVAPEKALVLKPAKILFEEAVTLPVAATTALKALRDKGNIQKEQKVLIVGAAGGVGTFAVQLAKYYGTIITAVCGPKNIAQATALGADHVIDYTREDFTKSNERYDLIVAINGNYPLLGYRKILSSNGTYVMVGGGLLQIMKSIFFGWLLSFGKKKMRYLSAKSNQKDLDFVVKLLENQKIKSVIERRYSLDRTAEAMQYLSEGHAQGKVIITVEG
ncbi:NADPH:quinone reductase [Arenibacter palladensis]|uniref:NADPH:quinone reductase n=1 Tax=Arenibacter palladensis TaxID=237373 RepID=A0A1M5EV22_9FLAO|nr:NAD(P)-dependent alcohol dehydrogenase [Arenibacter palladensis]SHF82931.1 NADPH:quinone reductase [Arenibacter palladensis]